MTTEITDEALAAQEAVEPYHLFPRRIESGQSAGGYSLEPPMTFGQVVRRERERRGLTLDELGDRLTTHDKDYGHEQALWAEAVEQGDYGYGDGSWNLTLADVLKFARAFDLTPQQLLADVGRW